MNGGLLSVSTTTGGLTPAARRNSNTNRLASPARKGSFIAPLALQCGITILLLLACVHPLSAAESVTVREISGQTEKWDQWIREKTVLNISGRYEGRVAKQFHLAKLQALITPARTTVLPIDIRSGQRLTVTGVFRKTGTRYFLDVTRIAAGSTDFERVNALAERVDRDKPELLYALADEYVPIAEFYKDEDLTARLQQLRVEAFDLQRKQRANDPVGLLQLTEYGPKIGIAPERIQAIRFESLVQRSKADALTKLQLLDDVRKMLDGWDERNAFTDSAVEQRFLKDLVAEYEVADESTRRLMHRRFFRTLKLPELLKTLKSDGSNGDEVAESIITELPEESADIRRCRAVYVEYRLKRVPQLTRNQLEDLQGLLQDSGRENEFFGTVDTWLQAQEARLNNQQLAGMLLMADEYLFAFERWKQKRHGDAGVDLLKRAWLRSEKAAPKEAASIAERLERLGWTRMHDNWMTMAKLKTLPRSDVELAMREGRVVAGMKREQIVGTLGEPTRRVRVVSAQSIQEIWIFGEAGSTAIAVHLQRGRYENPEESVAILVTTTGQ